MSACVCVCMCVCVCVGGGGAVDTTELASLRKRSVAIAV